MGHHQSSFDPPPEGSAKCSLDLRALHDSLVVQRLHATYCCTSELCSSVPGTLTTLYMLRSNKHILKTLMYNAAQ